MRVFADVIHLYITGWACPTKVGMNPMTFSLSEEKRQRPSREKAAQLGGPAPGAFRGRGPCGHLDFRVLASRTVSK